MKLLTKAIEEKLLKAHSVHQHHHPARPPIIVKFFNPTGSGTWYITEGEQLPDGDWMLFGLCDILEPELGYVALSELQSYRGPLNLGIERDLHFSGKFLDTSKFPVEVVS